MKDIFEKEGCSIFRFKKGDIIIRVKPVIKKKLIYNENLGITIDIGESIDNSYRRPMEFICIENNKIYLQSVIEDSFWKKKIVSIANLEEYTEDWALFVLPEGMKINDCI